MKLKKKNKNKKTKENIDQTDATSQQVTSQPVTSYPEEHNPFAEEDLLEEEENDSKKKKKKKKEKLKKEKKRKGSKKVKKLKGKRERAVSRAVLEEINTNNNSNKRETVINPGRFTPHGSISNGNSPAETRTEGSFLAFNQKPRDKSPSRVSQLKQEAVTSPKMTSSEPGADKITLKPSRLSSGDLKKLHDFKKTSDDVTRDVASTSQHRKVTIESCKDDKIEEIEEPKRERAVTRRARTASVLVSSRERRKKKRLRLAKKWKRIKGKKKNVGDDSESLKNFNPKPANRNIENQNLEKLRHQVDEVKTLTQYNVVEELHKRESALIELEKNTATLEKFAESFAKTGHDIQLKKKAQNRCCGIFSGCRACWYICACDRGLKKKNLKKKLPPPTRANADAYEDDDVSYQTTLLRHQNETTMTPSKQKSTDTSSVDRKLLTEPSVTSSTSSIVNSVRNSRLFARLSRASLPFAEESTRSDSRCDDKQDRKYSSTSAIHDIIKKNNKTVSRDAKKSIKRIASQFDDEEQMKRATELLLLDHD